MIDPERGIEMPARTRRFMQELAGRNFDAGARGAATPANDPATVQPATAPVSSRVPVSLVIAACVVVLLVGLAWQLAP